MNQGSQMMLSHNLPKLPQQPAHKFIRKQQIESKRHGTLATKNQSLARIVTKK
jgi:hypothetical protein